MQLISVALGFGMYRLVRAINHFPELKLPRVDVGAGTSLGEYSYPCNSLHDSEFGIVWKMDDVDMTRALERLDFYYFYIVWRDYLPSYM